MVQTTTKSGVTIQIDFPEDEKKENRYVQPSYVKACQGNEPKADLLDYIVYCASCEIKNKKLEGCKVVTLTQTHEKIIRNLQHKVSEKTLINYLREFNARGLVLSAPYQRDLEVHLDRIQEVITNPPAPKQRSSRQKGCNAEGINGVQHSCQKGCNAEHLQKKVEELQEKVEHLQLFAEMLQPYNIALRALVEQAQETKISLPLYITNILPTITNSNVVANANNTPSPFSLPVFEVDTQVSDETFKIAVLDEWREEKGYHRIYPKPETMLGALKRLQAQNASSQDNTPTEHHQDTTTEATDSLETQTQVNTQPSQKLPPNAPTMPTTINKQAPIVKTATDISPVDGEDNTLPSEQETPPPTSGARKPRKPAQPKPEKPDSPVITLTEEEQAFYDLYCSMPMILIKPKITEKVKEQCGKLAPHLKTRDQLFKFKNWMAKDKYYKDKGFRLPMLVVALNDWSSSQELIDLQKERNDANRNTAIHTGSNVSTSSEAAKQKAIEAKERILALQAELQAARVGA